MPLAELQASPHPDGNQITLDWTLPSNEAYTGVRVVRGMGSYPVSPDDGIKVAEADGLESIVDSGLKAEEVYYYTIFPYVGLPSVFEIDRKNRISAMATSPQDYGGSMYDLLPAIYHRYDKDSETLKRFLDLTGGQLDQLHSFAKASGELKNFDKVDGNLLPLLAEWIGWKTDNKLEFGAQRQEIRHAPAIYKTVGIIPTVEATTKRIGDWESRTKEFVHNIFSSNQPERLNIWSMLRDNTDIWSESPELLSLDFAYAGRPTSTVDNHGIRWLFYHTLRKGHWEVWYKTSPTVSISLTLLDQLVTGPITTELLLTLNDTGLSVTPDATISTATVDQIWNVTDTSANYVIERHAGQLLVYSISGEVASLSASLPLVVNDSLTHKDPCVALQDQSLWLFWSVYDQADDHWHIQYRNRTNAQWSNIGPAMPDPSVDIANNPFAVAGIYDPLPQRRNVYGLVDDADRLWLFWLENDGTGWQLRYNRRDGLVWGTQVVFPAADSPRVDSDLSVVIQQDPPDQRIYVFWSRPAQTSTPGQVRWEVSYRVKTDLNLDAANWSAIESVPKHAISDDHHDREPCPILSGTDVELFWSSNREDTGWSLWRSILSDPATNSWGPAERLTPGAYSQRNPLPIIVGDETWLIYRTNQCIAYESKVYGATQTFDERYTGSSTMDVRQGQKLALRKQFSDIQHYTYDSGNNGIRTDENWIARDTIGAYLDNSTLSLDAIENGIARLRPVLKEFMPMTDRAVFITNQELHTEYIYSYGQPATSDSYFITSTYEDEFTSVLETDALEEGEDFSDRLET